jgi:hypothetical protein
MGNDSLNLLACKNIRTQKAEITKKVRSKVIIIDITLFILILQKNLLWGEVL